MATAAEILTAVNDAILALIQDKVSSISFNGRTYVYQDLDKLRAMRKELRKETRTVSNEIRVADISGA